MTPKFALLAVSLLAALSLPAAEMTKLTSTPGSNKIRVEGTSSVHDWQLESAIIGGSAEVGPGFPLTPGAPVKPGPVDAKVTIFIPVHSLKSLEKDGKPFSTAMDNRMYDALREADNKRITYTLTELNLKEAPKTAEAPYQFEAKGELCVGGVTNKITMPVNVTVLGENKVKFAGTVTVKMTDFKIEPPALTVLGLGIKTGDDVKLFFEWIASKRAPAN
jgi:hypothetical protein